MSADYELSESRKRRPKNMSQYDQLNPQQPEINPTNDLIENKSSDVISALKVQDDMDITHSAKSRLTKSKSKSKSKSKKGKKSKSKSSRKQRSKADYGEDYHSLGNEYTNPSKYSSKYESLDERKFNIKRVQSSNQCITKTAPFNALNNKHLQVNADLIDDNIISQQQHDQHDHHEPHHREDASNLAFPVNPFDHLMPHKDDFGTPNMAWIGEDGLVHTPQGGVYAKTTEAIANFRRELKYDSGWHRTRQRYICLILLIMFLTVCAVVVLLIARDVNIVDANLVNGTEHNVWKMNENCALNESVSKGCNVTIKPLLDIYINNRNWVPATINEWNIKHLFFCDRSLQCPSGGTEFGTDPVIKDKKNEINRKDTGSVVLNDTQQFKLGSCQLDPPSGTFCEWERSCIYTKEGKPPGHFKIKMEIAVELSFALQASTLVTTTVWLGTDCNGTALVCLVDEVVKSSSKLCQ